MIKEHEECRAPGTMQMCNAQLYFLASLHQRKLGLGNGLMRGLWGFVGSICSCIDIILSREPTLGNCAATNSSKQFP